MLVVTRCWCIHRSLWALSAPELFAQVWAYHPSRTAGTPPASDWNVPHDGDIDPSFTVSATSAKPRLERVSGSKSPPVIGIDHVTRTQDKLRNCSIAASGSGRSAGSASFANARMNACAVNSLPGEPSPEHSPARSRSREQLPRFSGGQSAPLSCRLLTSAALSAFSRILSMNQSDASSGSCITSASSA